MKICQDLRIFKKIAENEIFESENCGKCAHLRGIYTDTSAVLCLIIVKTSRIFKVAHLVHSYHGSDYGWT